MAANSSRATSTALDIFWSASLRVSLINASLLVRLPGRRTGGTDADERADLFTLHDPEDVPFRLHPENDHRQVILHAQGERGRVGDLQALLQCLDEGDLVVLHRVGVCS